MTHDETAHEARLQRIDDCRNLYLKYNGKNHELIEREMRELGHADFHRRIMYDRFERGRHRPGWIGSYGFNHLVRERNLRRGVEEERSGGVGEESETETLLTSSTPPLPHSAKPELPDFPEFQEWLRTVSPTMHWEWKHQVYIYKRLRRVFEGDCKRLMIFLPPRHGKSELVTVRYAAWCLKQDPSLNVIIGSYNQRLANRFSRKIRRVLTDDAALSEPPAVAKDPTQGCVKEIPVGLSARCQFPPNAKLQPPATAGGSDFPFAKQRPANSEAEWETAAGGGLRAVGVGGGVTGFGAGLIIIDDPVKSRAEAESQTFRDNIWDWFNDDLYTRLEPDGKMILIQTRWHEDDLAGRLLRESQEEGGEQWEVVNLPALAESTSPKGTNIIARGKDEVRNPGYGSYSDIDPERVEQVGNDVAPLQGAGGFGTFPGVTLTSFDHPRLLHSSPSATRDGDGPDGKPKAFRSSDGEAVKSYTADPLNRQPGEALCPERFNEEALARLKRKLGSYSFASLYQQHPVPAEGGLFKREWFKNMVSFAPPNLRWYRGYDLGITKGADADYTASLRVAFDRDGKLYIDGGFRKQIEYPEQRRYILGRIEAERDTVHGIELSANGHAVIQDLRQERNIQGRAFCGIKVKGTKVSRAVAWIALAEEGRVRLVRGAWNSDFVEEACSFPSGTHDDQIDAVSIAVNMCRRERSKLYTF